MDKPTTREPGEPGAPVAPEASATARRGRRAIALAGWLLLTFSAAAVGGGVSPGSWYASLAKPAWTPPGWLFGPVWTLLYALMGVAAWLIWREGGWKAQRRGLDLYLLQLALNALWTPLFFGLHRPDLALVGLVGLDLAVLAATRAFWRVRRVAALLLVPYALWLAFATALNAAIWRLNG